MGKRFTQKVPEQRDRLRLRQFHPWSLSCMLKFECLEGSGNAQGAKSEHDEKCSFGIHGSLAHQFITA